jgi:hypothetical protein
MISGKYTIKRVVSNSPVPVTIEYHCSMIEADTHNFRTLNTQPLPYLEQQSHLVIIVSHPIKILFLSKKKWSF